jgi:hypothetical protein
MATIEIKTPDGKTISLNAPDGATADQIHAKAQAAVEHYKATMGGGQAKPQATQPAAQAAPTTPGSDLPTLDSLKQDALTAVKQSPLGMAAQGVNSMMQGVSKLAGMGPHFAVSEGVKKAADIATIPQRAGRALGVAAADGLEPQQLVGLPPLSAPNTQNVMDRGQAAFKPGFEPNSMAEKAGAFLGENGTLAAGAAALPGGAIAQGLAAGTATAASQASETGKIGAGGVLAAAITPALVKGVAKGYQTFKMAKNAVDAEAIINGKVAEMTDTLNNYEKQIKESNLKIKRDLGVLESPEEIQARIRRFPKSGGQLSVGQVQKELDELKNPNLGIKTRKTGLLNSDGKEVTETALPVDMNPPQKLKQLAMLDDQINQQIDWKAPSKETLALKNAVREEILKQGDAGRKFIEAQKAYSAYLKIQGRLKASMETPEGARSTLVKIAKGDIKASLTNAAGKQLAAIKALETSKGKQFIEPVKQAVKDQEMLKQAHGAKMAIGRHALGAISPRGYHMIEALRALRNARSHK